MTTKKKQIKKISIRKYCQISCNAKDFDQFEPEDFSIKFSVTKPFATMPYETFIQGFGSMFDILELSQESNGFDVN